MGEVPHWLSELNPAQREAAECAEGPALILAGAGSGKTRVIVHRIAHLILGLGVEPRRILAVTFTNKAADEMKERVERLLGHRAGPIWIGTFHRFGAQVLRRHIERFGYTSDFAIYDETDQVSLLKKVMKEQGLTHDFDPKRVRTWVDEIKRTALTDLEQTPADPRSRTLWPVLRAYQDRLRQSNAVDFGDLLLLPHQLFDKFPETILEYRARFHYVMVDEYQDTNRIQYLLVRQLVGDRRNLFVVGDEDQSIYGWRGADVANILNFEKDFPEAKVVLLEQNYRSTQTVIEAASELIGRNLSRKPKRLWTRNPAGEKIRVYAAADEREEARWVVEEVLRLRGLGRRLSEIAIFYRTHAQSRPLEDALRSSSLNYAVYGGPRFYDRREVKDVLAYLRLLLNPEDEVSLFRVINMPVRGIGDKTLEAVTALRRERGLSWAEAIRATAAEGRVGTRAAAGLTAFQGLLAELTATKGQLSTLTEATIAKSGYRRMLEAEDTIESLSRMENLEELRNAVTDYVERAESPSLAGYLEQVSLTASVDRLDPEAGSVTLMTLHCAKGLEFPAVFLVGMEEGVFPHARSLSPDDDEPSGAGEEERRLCYVGMTRARELLAFTWAENRLEHGARRGSDPSRFLNEIPVRFLRQIGRKGALRPPAPRRETRYRPERESRRSFGDSEVVYDQPDQPEEEEKARPVANGVRFKPGDRVYHEDYGEGVVKRFEDTGERTKIVIRFPAGSKKFLARFVRLEPLD